MTETAMTPHAVEPEALQSALARLLGERAVSLTVVRGELTLTVRATDYLSVMQSLRDAPEARFEQLIDLCGMDYQT
ncbi:MAG: NADH-quinone oxidoreductase subunit C, partial [Burkholderiales bacterium]